MSLRNDEKRCADIAMMGKAGPTAKRPRDRCEIPQMKMTRIGTRTVVSLFEDKLPREIRDICYGHMTGGTDFDVLGRSGGPLQSYHGRVQLPPDEARLMAQLPRSLAKEYLQIFYERNCFHLKDTADIPAFLECEMFSSGVKPRDHVRRVVTTFQFRRLTAIIRTGFTARIHKSAINQLLENLRELKTIRYKRDFQLVFQIPSGFDIGITLSTLRAIAPAFQELETMGLVIKYEILESRRRNSLFRGDIEKGPKTLKGLPELQSWLDGLENG